MKGPLHDQLHRALRDAWQAKRITQESLAQAIGNSQVNAGLYLRGGKAGALDLDQADAALRHIGSSLRDFLDGLPARPLTEAERLGQLLTEKPVLREVVQLLRDVPRKQLGAVVRLIETLVLPALGMSTPTTAAPTNAPTPARRTKGVRSAHR